ncbi:uncharacterized protein LOC110908707 [Helianthus annuus]|uniref:uncharacterized protein LOC110908707 n=1 Tax=Helianthus annuus TaxID=4232 RepID=UPI000B8F1F7D|nr:uncharacterized protein LOC110908707 [Helianthus annuus]
MTDQRPIYRSHISRFWENATYDEASKVISSVVEVNGKKETILVTEALVREVMNFPDEANYPTRFPERMVKGCMLRLGYRGALNTGNYLKSKFQKSFKFLIHCILISLSHTKGSYDQMRDHQMNMLTALVLNKKYNFSHIVFHYMAENFTTNVRAWKYPRFVQMLIDHAYPGIDRNIKNDLLVQAHMSNNTLKQLVKYHPNHPEPDLVVENFGYIKDVKYADPDPENHQNWRNQEEMKEALYADELKIMEKFKDVKNEWYVKESGRRRRLATPTIEGEGSSSKPKKKQKMKVQTMLIDEPDEDVPGVNVEKEQEMTGAENIVIETDLFTTDAYFVDNVVQTVTSDIQKEKEKVLDDVEGDDVDKDTTSSSSSSEDEMIDEVEHERRMREEIEKGKLIKKRKRQEQEDAPYVPSLEHVSESQSTPKGHKKAASRKRATPKHRMSKRPKKIFQKTPTPPRLEKKVETDQTEIDILKVRVSELEEEKNRRDSQNEYFQLKNKELAAAKAVSDHEVYMLNRVVKSLLGMSVDQKFEELKLEDLRAERQAELERQMKDKGKGVEGSSAMPETALVPSMVIDNPEPISAVPGLFEEETPTHELIGGEDEEDDEDDDDNEFVYSASSHSSKGDDDDDAAGGSDVYKEMLKDVNPEISFDFEEDLESFDINKQQDYKYDYVEDADIYDRVQVEDCSDSEDVPEDTSKLPTLMEFFAAENREELRQKVIEAVNENVFENLKKDAEKESQSNVEKEDRSKWFKDSHERKFKRPLKYFQRDRTVSLGDVISWGFLPQVNAYAIRREYGVQYFKRLYDIMSLPWWDVEELSKVRSLDYPVRQNDKAMWGYIKYEALKGFKKWKPHRPRCVQRVDPVSGITETILNVKPPRTMTTIPMPEMEQDFYKGFIDWVYNCITTEAIITYRAGGELRNIHVYDPMWLVNCSAKDIECLFIHKIRYSPADKEQALQFQRVVSLCFQKSINSENKWNSSWWSLDEKMKRKAKRERDLDNQRMEEHRGMFMREQEKEEKARKKENEKIRVTLSKKPKPKEEKYKAI